MILGAGYTGLRIYQQATKLGWRTFATSRKPHVHLRPIPLEDRVQFDLTQANTWSNLPDSAHLIWCFPAIPLELVKKFFMTRSKPIGRLLVLGSTSAYQIGSHPITEDTALKSHLPRVQSEEYLRTALDAVIIRLAGLYGPGRHVLNWIRTGKIQNVKKWVNLLHVEDAAGICIQALYRASPGNTYLASDGYPRTWNEICSVASSKWHVPIPTLTSNKQWGKQVSIHKLCTELHYTFRYPNLYQALEQIEISAS